LYGRDFFVIFVEQLKKQTNKQTNMFEVLIGAIIITAVTTAILFLFFKSEVVWWEIGLLLAISLIVGASFKWIATANMTKDYEYWGARLDRVEYYEDWDEWIEQTCSETCCCDSEGSNCSTTYYDCSYRLYHSAYWRKVDHLGNSHSITEQEYERLNNKMCNTNFKDMHRDYYHDDGDMHFTRWNKKTEDYECIATKHTYENKTQAVKNVFNFEKVDTIDIKQYQLFSYPEPSGQSRYYQKNILGYDDPLAEHQLQILNGELGSVKQLKTFILVFNNQPSVQTSLLQEALWKGGNKNEVVITMNIDDTGKPTWCKVFSWSEQENFKVHIRDFVMKQEKLNLVEVVKFSFTELKSNFIRKEFSDFDYLEVKLKPNQLMCSIIVSIIANILFSIFIVINEWNDGWKNYRKKYSSNYNRYIRQ